MEILIASVIAFASTNIDDIFILMLFFGSNKFRERQIVVGQLLGISTLIIISLIGSLIGLFIDQTYIGLLGLVPVYLGIKGLIALLIKKDGNSGDDHDAIDVNNKGNVLSIAAVTIANGGDNIGIYVPLLATLSLNGKIFMITTFLIMTYVWCMMAKYLTRHPVVAKSIERYGHFLTPVVLLLLGVYIIYDSGTFHMLLE